MKRIAVFGSTGSVGLNTLDVIRKLEGNFKVAALSTNSNVDILARQIKEFRPQSICINEGAKASGLLNQVLKPVKIFSANKGILELIDNTKIDLAVMGISGSNALAPLLRLIDNGIDIALANKEALVMAGPLIMKKAAEKKVRIIPVDSEQAAIWQCLKQSNISEVRHIYLTASGGPFRKLSSRGLRNISVAKALKHPRWKMGAKISIDSATLMNKGLELLETAYLFGVSPQNIKIVIHPESVIHSMVEFIDGVIMAQLSIADMRIPLQYALTYPNRINHGFGRVDFFKLKQLNFEPPDFKRFPCLGLAYDVAKAAGSTPCALNAANEVAVEKFLNGKLNFISIPKVIEKVLAKHVNKLNPDLKDIMETDRWGRQEAYKIIEGLRYD